MAIIQQPTSLSLLGNLQKFVVASSAPVSFKLYDAGTLLADELYEAPLSGNISIDVSQLIKERLSFTLSATNFYQQTSIVKQFSAVVDGQTINFSVIRAGVANLADTPTNWLKANFLTWQPTTKAVSYHSPEWLTYYATQSATLKLKAYFSDDTSSIITLGSFSAGQAFTANVQYAVIAGLLGNKYPTHYDVWVEASSTPLTYTQRYYYSQPKAKSEQWYLFENSLGGIDTIRTSGASTFSGSHSHDLAQIDNTVSELNVTTVRFYTQNTGALDTDERQWLKDFFASSKKYIHHNGALRSIVLTEDSAQYSTIDLPSSFNFTFRFADDTVGLLNLVRNASAIPPVITVPNLSLPNFTIPPRLSEFPRVDLGEGVIIPAFDPNSDTPSVTTVGALIAAAAIEILKQVPGNTPGGSGQLVTLIRLASEFAGSDDDVFSSSRTLAEIQRLIDESPKLWQQDEDGNVYCTENVYSLKGMSTRGRPEDDDDEPFPSLDASLTLVSDAVAQLVVGEVSALLSRQGHQHTTEDVTDLLTNFYTKTEISTLLSELDGGGGSSVQMEDVGSTAISLTIDGLTRYIARSNHNHNIFTLEGINSQIGFTDGYVLSWDASTAKLVLRAPTGGNGGVADSVDWANITNKPGTFPPSSHAHIIANITGLQTVLDGKANTSHAHAISNIANLQSTLNNKVDKVTGKSLISDTEITRLSTVVNQTLNSLGAEPAFSKNTAFNKNFGTGKNDVARGNHTHSADDINSGIFAVARIPNLAISKIINLATELAAKAPLNSPVFVTKITTPVVDFNNGWTLEAGADKIVTKRLGVVKGEINDGGIVSMGGVAARGVPPVGEEMRLSENWTVTETAGGLVYKKNGVIKQTIPG